MSDEQYLKQGLQKIEEEFYANIKEVLLEREHNKTFVQSIKFKIK